MRKSLSVAFAICCVAIACRKNEPPATAKARHVTTKVIPADAKNARVDTIVEPVPAFVDHSVLGTKLDKDGMVHSEATSATQGETVYLTMWFRESPVGLHTHVSWKDAAKKEVQHEERPMNGSKIATYALNTAKLKPGKYHVDGYCGGNVAAEKDFDIVAHAKGKQ